MTAYFVSGVTTGTILHSWTPMLRRGRPDAGTVVAYRACPENTSMGMESIHPPRIPVIALVAPGPVVTQTAARRLSTLAYASAAMAQACS